MTNATVDPTPDPMPEAPQEGIRLHPNGTVTLWVDGTRYPLRRPKVGEYRKLREALDEVSDRINAGAEEAMRIAAEIEAAIKARGDGAEPTPEERQRDREQARRLNREREEATAEWWSTTVGLLSAAALSTDDVPPWALDTDEILVLIVHWRTAPSLSGAR